jgi:hypothetical protein
VGVQVLRLQVIRSRQAPDNSRELQCGFKRKKRIRIILCSGTRLSARGLFLPSLGHLPPLQGRRGSCSAFFVEQPVLFFARVHSHEGSRAC